MNNGGTGSRRRSREMALQLLFQTEFVPGGFQTSMASEMLLRFKTDFEVEQEISEYGGILFLGIAQKMTEIDAIIQSQSSHWKVSRMGLVDLSVMRIAVFEMKCGGEPLNPRIAIDEAVEIAKKFGSTDSGSFVNGILDQVARGV